jgi:serine/threonine protein kinase
MPDATDDRPGESADDVRTTSPGEIGYPLGTIIDRYRLLQVIGAGGFGVVYEAEQQEPVRRRVALKVIKPGMDTKAVVARFEAERQALAVMDHPGVATVFDAGATPEGRPYFVMELVRGEPITEFCDKHRLTLRERCDLFILVCEAVQHAHAKGVIHRDLKPGNILVHYEDGHAKPKVIDFGVAKALHQRLADSTVFTERGQLIGTPEYMSPEQAEMSGVDVDTRTDIYSLGVVLYELLAGRPPFDPKTLRAAGLAEIQRIIREVEPPKPSTRFSTAMQSPDDPEAGTRLVRARRSDSATVSRLLRRDLDWVVMRCLEKDRERRYDTASALAMELRRFLASEPVLAGPPSPAYRLRKFLRRRRGPVAAALAVIVVSVGFGGFALAMWQREARQRIATERAEAEAVAMLERLSDYVLAPPASSSLADEEAAFAQRVEREAAADPRAEASLRLERAMALYRAGDGATFARHAREAARLLADLDPGSEDHINALTLAGLAERRLRNHAEAERYGREALAVGESVFAPDADETMALLMNLAATLRQAGRELEAMPIFERVLAVRTERFGVDSREAIRVRRSLTAALRGAGRYAEAVEAGRPLLATARATLGPDDPDTLQIASNLGLALVEAGADREALPLLRDTLDRTVARYGLNDVRTVVVQRNLAAALRAYAMHEEAAAILDDAIRTQFGLTDGDSDRLLGMLLERAESLTVLLQPGAAEALLIVAEGLCDRMEATERRSFETERARIERMRVRLTASGRPSPPPRGSRPSPPSG